MKIKLNERGKRILDVICILFIFTMTLILADACRINMHESPVDGIPQGSSYTPSAIGNPEWVAEHPRLANVIGNSKMLEVLHDILMLFSVLLLVTIIYPLPVLCFSYLSWRVWTKRKNLVYGLPVTLTIVWLVFITVFIRSAIVVMMD
jgi:hypothetical protein